MTQRHSEFERIPLDRYQTPAWVTEALLQRLPLRKGTRILEPAAGEGQMVNSLRRAGYPTVAIDIDDSLLGLDTVADFLTDDLNHFKCRAIITNPPYNQMEAFIRRALSLRGVHTIAVLGMAGFDYGKTRRELFEHQRFTAKLVLTRRVVWFDDPYRKIKPSTNHAWYIWGAPNKRPGECWYQYD